MSGFPFLSQSTFLQSPASALGQRFAVAGIAWDGCVTNRPGARFGPRAIRTASHMLCDGTHPWFNVDLAGGVGAMPATCPCPTPACQPCGPR